MKEQFSRTAQLLGEQNVEKLFDKHVIVFGVGGVGGYVVEALARSGVGAISIVDNDFVNESNINRQIIALHSTVGKAKVEVIKNRILDINPNCKVFAHNQFFLPENSSDFDFSKYDYVVDAVDTVTAKIEIIKKLEDICFKLIDLKPEKDEELSLYGMDSLTLVSLIVEVENIFSITFNDDDLNPNNLKTLDSIAEILENYL